MRLKIGTEYNNDEKNDWNGKKDSKKMTKTDYKKNCCKKTN